MDIKIKDLINQIESILGPKGCPWGKAQSAEALCHYIIEESYEVIDAAKENDLEKIEEELGDVLFATLFAIIVACKNYHFEPDNIMKLITQKIKRRHPHVFENPRPITLEQLRVQWEAIKAEERAEKKLDKKESLFSSVAKSMPLVTRAMKWVELGESNGFKYTPDEKTLEGQFMQLIMDGLNQHENLGRIFENSIQDYQIKFEKWVEEEKPEIVS